MKKHCLVFDLSYNSDLKFYIPSGIIVEIENDKLGYILKIANEETLASYGLELDEAAVQLVSIAQKLNPGRLQKKYNAGNRIPKSLKALMADEQGKKIIFQFVSNSLQQFYKLLLSTSIPLVIHSEKNEIAEKYRLTFSKEKLSPKLYFHKKEEGIDYRLSLWKDADELIPCQEKFTILLDQPSYVIHNQMVYELQHINANKLRPFLTKEIIQIPNRSSATYFNTFIKKVIKKAPIEAEGFEVITSPTCTSCYIQPTTTIYSKVYLLELFFVYDNHTFSIMDNAQKHVQLHHDEDGHFTVFETLRNKNEEQKYIDIAKNVGMKFLDSNLASFCLDIKNMDTYDNIAKLLQVKDQLKENAIHTELQLHKLLINEHIAAISTHYQENKDWFDVQMNIAVGEFQFPFTNLVSHLKSGKRLYQLPNGSHFLIPKEWFSRYKPLMNLGKVEKNTLQIQKNQFTLLEETGIAKKEEFSKDILPYQTTGNVKATLRAYQEEGVNWLVKNYQMQLGSCLADDMGLGKTLQTLAYLDFVFSFFEADFVSDEEPSFPMDLFSIAETNNKTLKALIVSPSSLTFNWKNEAQKFCPHFSSLSYVGQNRQLLQQEIPSTDLVFTSYGVLLRDIDFFKTLAFHFIIIDESQHIKNRKSKIFKAINSIQATHKVSLSGTPIENSLSDLWSQMQFINPHLLGSYAFFNEHFKKPIEKEKQEERIHELKTLIQPYLLRRTKTEVAKDLPELSEQLYYTEMASEQAKLYEKEKSKVRNYLIDKKLSTDVHASKHNTLSILNALLKLRQLANHPKLIKKEAKSGKFEDVTAYLETLLQAKQKTLVFSSFTSHLQLYTNWCDEQNIAYQLLTGKTSIKAREKAVHNFENKDESLLFFISLKAGGEGLNLTKANYVIILDPWWNPFAELQAIGRAHRIGQTQKVNLVRFIAKNTIEEKINQLQQTKKYLSDSIIENQIMVEILNDLEEFLG